MPCSSSICLACALASGDTLGSATSESIKSNQKLFNFRKKKERIVTHSSTRSCSHQAAAQGASPAPRSPASFEPRPHAVSVDRRRPAPASRVRGLWLHRTRLDSRAWPCTRPGRGCCALGRSMSRMSAGKARRESALRLVWLLERRMCLWGCGE
jgi:hypothetical protein